MASEGIVAPRRVYDEEVLSLGDFLAQIVKVVGIRSVEYGKPCAGQSYGTLALRLGAVFEIAVERTLTLIEIDRGNFRTLIGERDGDMNRGRRLAGPALFIRKDNTVRAQGACSLTVQMGCRPVSLQARQGEPMACARLYRRV